VRAVLVETARTEDAALRDVESLAVVSGMRVSKGAGQCKEEENSRVLVVVQVSHVRVAVGRACRETGDA
jgi:hypothetical protein